MNEVTIAQQIYAIRRVYSHFITSHTSHYSLKVCGSLQPTSRSITYKFELRYHLAETPKLKIVSPSLLKNEKGEDPPHLYPNGDLCLYRPKYNEFTKKDYLADTVIPWTSLWLYYYEIWQTTGEWQGGGEHPIKLKPKTK